MPLTFEVFAAGPPSVEALWAVVGDPRRLPEWTDADRVERVSAEPLSPGAEIVTVDGERRLAWRVDTMQPQLIEVSTTIGQGWLGIGARVARDPMGARIILAGALRPTGSAWRARLVDAPRLRRRFDRWAHAALRAAREPPAPEVQA